MEIVRIPTTYSTQIQYLSDEDMSYVFKGLFTLSKWEVIDVEDSMRGGLLESIWREVIQMENKARAKKWEKRLSYELATLRVDTESSLNGSDNATKSKQIKTSQSKSIQKDSNESKELALNKKNPDIDILITELKNKADELWIAYDKTKDRMFAKHITQAKEFWEFCEKIELSPVDFAINIMIASDRIWFWKWTCSWPMKIYQNYSEVYNLIKTKKESSEIINIT